MGVGVFLVGDGYVGFGGHDVFVGWVVFVLFILMVVYIIIILILLFILVAVQINFRFVLFIFF